MKLYNTKEMLKEFGFVKTSIPKCGNGCFYLSAYEYESKDKDTKPRKHVKILFGYNTKNKRALTSVDVYINKSLIKVYDGKEITKILKDRFYLSKDLYLLLNYLFGSDVYRLKRFTGESWTGWTIYDVEEAIFALTEDKEYSKTVADDDKHDVLERLEDTCGGFNYDDMTYFALEMLREKYNWEN